MEYMERNGTAPQILIVDDVETNVMILESIISEMGYTPRCASLRSNKADCGEAAPAYPSGCVYAGDGRV